MIRALGRHLLFRGESWDTPAPHQHLVFSEPLERVGWGGSRRNCYKIGETGLCAKFYKPAGECVPEKMKAAIRRDIAARRFDKRNNSSSEEVYVCDRYRHTMPEEISGKLPPVCERVYHPEWGWGILETYYTNPDGTAIIPFEFEIKRQAAHPEIQREIYRQSRDLLLALIRNRAYFYEPGNFHVRLTAEGKVELKLIDFEPESKTLVPLEMVSGAFRAAKLRRKARRYLTHIRNAYHVDVPIETEIG